MHPILDKKIDYLKGVGPQKSLLISKELDIHTYRDMLYHFPYRYIDATKINKIAEVNDENDFVQLRGIIMNIRFDGQQARKRLVCDLQDTSGSIELVWFQGGSFIEKQLIAGTVYNVFGKLNRFNNSYSIPHPELELFDPQEQIVNKYIPLYPSTEKLRQRGINNRQFGKFTKQILEECVNLHFPEILPQGVIKEEHLISIKNAIYLIHYPSSKENLERAILRIKYQELLAAQLKINKLKISTAKNYGYIFQSVGSHFNNFYHHHLPFPLTDAQKRVIKEIRNDMLTGHQMNRLLQGDVGSGKTIVALMSMLIAMDNGFQCCLMAPTEILARQHFLGIQELIQKMDLKVALLTGSVKGKARKEILNQLADGSLHIIIGTHALVEDKVIFHNLGLAIIDEQHRFGVAQRSKLWMKNKWPPHMLVMTATPIPRTLAMTLYGDLDISVIDELPPGRKPIETLHRNENFRIQVMNFLRSEIEKGRQVYIVYPLINESETLDFKNLMESYEQTKSYFPYPQFKIAMVHGQQDPETKESNMRKFVSGEADILVSTTVIEVGVNVPNASVMIIESAERFGLSQLHQLRGRVGRGAEKSYCILMTGYNISKESRRRMSIMTETNDGFLISEEDLKMRGPGDIYGTKQSGTAMKFQLADIINDVELIAKTRAMAQSILNDDPSLSKYPELLLLLQQYSEDKTDMSWEKIS